MEMNRCSKSVRVPTIRKIPKIGTAAYHDYLHSRCDINSFFCFVLSMVSKLESMSEIAHKALVEVCDGVDEKNKMIVERKERMSVLDVLKKTSSFLWRLCMLGL